MVRTVRHEQAAPAGGIPAAEGYTANDVRTWAMRNGRSLAPAAFDVVLGAKSCRPEPFGLWTEVVVNELVWAGIVTWCRERDVECPERAAETLWSYLTFLHEHDRFAPGSDPVGALRGPLMSVAGLRRDGRERAAARRRHPSERARTARASAHLAPVVPLRVARRD